MKTVFLSVAAMAMILMVACTKDVENPSTQDSELLEAKSSMTLAERIANTGEMDSIILISNSLLSESLVPGYDDHLSSIPNITSERDVLTFYSKIFVDEASMYDKPDDFTSVQNDKKMT